MKNIIFFCLFIGLMAFASVQLLASPEESSKEKVQPTKTPKGTSKRSAQNKPKAKLGTDFVFDDSLMSGRYQFATEGVVTVENEKGIVDLLGVRQHFKDKLAIEQTRK